MAKLGIKITGDKKLLKKLAGMRNSVGGKVNRQAATKAGTPMLQADKSRVPVDHGLLKKAQVKKVTSRGKSANVIVGADKSVVGPDGEQPWRYDHLVEQGHVTEDGTVVPAAGYMRAAYNASIGTARAIYARESAAGVEREAMKGGK